VIARLALYAGVLSILAGCGASATTSSTAATPTPTATATPAPTPTVDVKATAAAAYLAAVGPYNAGLSAPAFKALCTSTRESDIKRCWAQGFTLGEAWLTALSAITFPPAMSADVSALISTKTKSTQIANSLSQEANPGLDTAENNAATTAANDSTAAAGVVRHDLGLPPVPAT
jgi:hypothetical protein